MMKEIDFGQILHILGWTQIHALWQILFTGMILLLIRTLITSQHPEWQYRVTTIVLLSLPLISAYTFFSMWRILAVPPAAGYISTETSYTVSEVLSQDKISHYGRFFSLLDKGSFYMFWLWCAGILLFGIQNFLSANRVRRIRKSSVPPEQRWNDVLVRLSEKAGLKRNVRMLVNAAVEIPFVAGIWKPVIVVPLSMLSGFSVYDVETILIHELEHIRRFDILSHQVVLWIRTIYFYHPVIWWMYHILETDRERSCDRKTIQIGGNPRRYAETLLQLSYSTAQAAVTDVALLKRKNQLYHRIKWIMEKMNQKQGRNPAGIILFLAVIISLWFTVYGQEVMGRHMNGRDDYLNSSHASWMYSDTGYTMTDDGSFVPGDPGITETSSDVAERIDHEAKFPESKSATNNNAGHPTENFSAAVEYQRKTPKEPEKLQNEDVSHSPGQIRMATPFFQDTTKKIPEIEAMTWEEIHQAQIESIRNLQEALRIAQDSLRLFSREAAESLHREMEEARKAYRESMEHIRSEEFRKQMEQMRQRIETYHFPQDSVRRMIEKQMQSIREMDWDSIYQKMEEARQEMEMKIQENAVLRREAMEKWHQQMEEAMQHHNEALKKQEELLEELEKEQKESEKDRKRKKTKL